MLLALPLALELCSPAAAQSSAPPALELVNPLATHTLQSLSATRERPLFAPTRRPPAPPRAPPPAVAVVAPPPPPSEPPALTLYGIVMEEGQARALVRAPPQNESLRLRVGDQVADWVVTEVDRRRLVLSLGDRSHTVELFGSKAERQVIVPAPALKRRVQTAPNTGARYEGRVPSTPRSQPSKDEPEL